MNCIICNHSTTELHRTQVLSKYDVSYFQCDSCKFIQTEKPYWIEEAYRDAITSLDIGLVSRNQYLLERVPAILDRCFPEAKRMVDYGGGYGMFVRMMRDAGYDFYRQDIYCENLFAKHFDVTDHPGVRYDLLTAFEVFEHLADPVAEMEKMLSFADNILFSTLLTESNKGRFADWWYVTPQTGQHIAFYSKPSLEFLAKKYNLHFYSNGENLHFFSKKKLDNEMVQDVFFPKKPFLKKVMDRLMPPPPVRPSLQEADYKSIITWIQGSK